MPAEHARRALESRDEKDVASTLRYTVAAMALVQRALRGAADDGEDFSVEAADALWLIRAGVEAELADRGVVVDGVNAPRRRRRR